MGAVPIIPFGKVELKHMIQRGLSQSKIAEEVYRVTGQRVTRQAVSQILRNYGIEPAHKVPRHSALLPWLIKTEHNMKYPAKMLRLESRVRAGMPITEDEQARLQRWKQKLKDENAVVFYNPNMEEGFGYAEPRPGIDTDLIYRPNVKEGRAS